MRISYLFLICSGYNIFISYVCTMATATTSQGKLKGSKCYTDKGIEYFEFLGIPYAKPPVGNLRFQSPQPPEKWNGIRDATIVTQNQIACQLDIMVKNQIIGSEDCLYLNVYTPRLPGEDEVQHLLPVMIYIHGGGFLYGNGIMKSECGPDFLIDNDVVVVSLNYRLGIFGFLALGIAECTGNMGLKDQIQALIWIQNNIHKFGGDKNNVTIFGVSAGAASVEFLMLSSKSKGLFHKAILQSGSSLNHWAINVEPQKLVYQLLDNMGYEESKQNHQTIYHYLKTCSSRLLTEQSFKIVDESVPERVFFGFVPTIEKDFGNGDAFLITKPYILLNNGIFNPVPVIKGFCETEGYMMSLTKSSAIQELNTNNNFMRHWAYCLTPNDCTQYNTKLTNFYSMNQVPAVEECLSGIEFFGDYDFISGIQLSAQIMSDHGAPVYCYKFSYEGKMNFFKNMFDFHQQGAAHADDVTYIFKNEISKLGDKCDFIVRDKMTKMWTDFAKTRFFFLLHYFYFFVFTK